MGRHTSNFSGFFFLHSSVYAGTHNIHSSRSRGNSSFSIYYQENVTSCRFLNLFKIYKGLQHWNGSSPTFLQKGSSHSYSACFLYQDLTWTHVVFVGGLPFQPCAVGGWGGGVICFFSLKFLAISTLRTLLFTKHTKITGHLWKNSFGEFVKQC